MSWMISQALMKAYENSHCSQGPVEVFLEDTSSDGEQSVQLSGSPTPQAYLCSDRMKAFSRLSRSGMMYNRFEESLGEDLLTWYQGDFLAKTSQAQEKAPELMENEVQCGITCSESSEKLSQNTASLKTPRTFVLKDLSPSSKDLPKQGIMRHGVCYQQKTVEPITSESECGLSEKELLPTPTCTANQLAPSMAKHKGCRALQALLPTPTCHNAKEGGYPAEGNRKTPTLGWCLGGKPHPNFTEWMMGWPSGWTDLKQLEMGKFQFAQQQHSSNL